MCNNNDIFAAGQNDSIIYDMYEALDIITPTDARGYFWHSGYFLFMNIV